tara:strand:+ start:104 stop:1081 length:978 start_codon:yes stop_codon:yes gene_type:complete
MDYLNLLVDTKKEFSTLLVLDLFPEISKGIYSILNHCKIQLEDNKNLSKLVVFQEMLSEIPNWNQSIISNETDRIKNNINYIEDLLTAVFISNMRLLCSVKNTNKKIKVKIPKLDLFIHKCYIYTARELWQCLYLFDENNNRLKIQKNNKKIENIIIQSIENVIRKLLPMKTILNDYLETNLSQTTDCEINNSLIDIINNQNNHQNQNNQNNLNDNQIDLDNNQLHLDDNQIDLDDKKDDDIYDKTKNFDDITTYNESNNNQTLIFDEKKDNNIDNNNPEKLSDENQFNNQIELESHKKEILIDDIVDTPNSLYNNKKLIKLCTS